MEAILTKVRQTWPYACDNEKHTRLILQHTQAINFLYCLNALSVVGV